MRNNLRIVFLLFIFLSLLVSACAGVNSSTQNKKPKQKTTLSTRGANKGLKAVIMGNVKNRRSFNELMMVVAFPANKKTLNLNSLNYVILDNSGEFMLYLPAGEYQLYVIVDFNDNNSFEKTETAGIYNRGTSFSLNEGELIKGLDIICHLQAGKTAEFPADLAVPYTFDSLEYSWENGKVVKIYDAIFSYDNANVGLWSAGNFVKTFGANIYLVEPFSPQKIPVLFVHGISGSPQDWIPFLIRLDREKFQPWFFYYPSGMQLKLVAKILNEKLIQLNDQFHFDQICLTAHSMGGFVTRTLLTGREFKNDINYIKVYVTLATPWTGFEQADAAVATSPIVLPSWADIASQSLFIKKLLKRPLPDFIPYHLFFGKDDKVSQGRALDERAFVGASGKYGFDVNHQSILSDKQVFQKYEEILLEQFH